MKLFKSWILSGMILSFFFGSQTQAVSGLTETLTENIAQEVSKNRNERHDIFTVLAFNILKSVNGDPYLLPSRVVQSDEPHIIKLAKEITSGKMSDKEKSMAIYHWVATNIKYDTRTYYKTYYTKDFKFKTAAETLEAGTAMCMGFSHLNAALHRAIGIKAKVVYGESHAWNEIKIDGRWQAQDATSGSGYLNNRTQSFVQQFDQRFFSSADQRKEGEYLW
ncbi:transglutaminase-like domain-containing protein [Bacillus sp. T33-2]|uniref:transglutaminase-like domain-containing protein n=1 Tax=Bacillus sp. T33-2 TaxID=2054168 RepID=UPI0015E0C788|nr:transglutaminase-like domain-containing protein [Bacillus sp. T33-2]